MSEYRLLREISDWIDVQEIGDAEVQISVAENYRSDFRIHDFVANLLRSKKIRALHCLPLDQIKALKEGQTPQSDHSAFSSNQARVIAYFKKAVQLKASDIHFEIGQGDMTRVMMRIHGDLIKVDVISKKEGEDLAATIVLSMCDVAEAQFNAHRQQDARLRQDFLRGLTLFGARYAHTPAVYGLYVVLRLLPDDSGAPPTLDALGFLPAQQTVLRKMLKQPEGIVILSGPTGSGKSTTLRTLSALYLDNTRQCRRLMTIEDPPEGQIEGAIQTAIIADKNNPDAVSQAWVRAISASLRLDPDALVVGEIRDENSAKTSLTAAMTGHLLLTTVHANDPINILERLVTMGIHPALLSDPQLMIGLISQRLVQLLCPECKKPFSEVEKKMSSEEAEKLAQFCDLDRLYFRRREGCESCHCGVVGRTVIAEVISPDEQFMKTYREQGKLAARAYWAEQLNGITRNSHLLHHIHAGRVDPLEADRVSPLDEDRRLKMRVEQ